MYSYQFIQRLPPHITLRTQKPIKKARIEAELHGELTKCSVNFFEKTKSRPTETTLICLKVL